MTLQHAASGQVLNSNMPPESASVSQHSQFTTSFKSFVQSNVRQILLQEDLEGYDRQTAQRKHSPKSPIVLIRVRIYIQFFFVLLSSIV
jgi:hypothetical protein